MKSWAVNERLVISLSKTKRQNLNVSQSTAEKLGKFLNSQQKWCLCWYIFFTESFMSNKKTAHFLPQVPSLHTHWKHRPPHRRGSGPTTHPQCSSCRCNLKNITTSQPKGRKHWKHENWAIQKRLARQSFSQYYHVNTDFFFFFYTQRKDFSVFSGAIPA